MRAEIPEPWASALVKAGVTDPRSRTRPSLNQLAKRVGRHTTTVTNMVHGNRRTDPALVQATAEVLGVPTEQVAAWVGRARSLERPYQPPAVAALLTEEQRNLVDALIRQLAAAHLREDTAPRPQPPQQATRPAAEEHRPPPRRPVRSAGVTRWSPAADRLRGPRES